jgi:serine/threonine protein kinase
LGSTVYILVIISVIHCVFANVYGSESTDPVENPVKLQPGSFIASGTFELLELSEIMQARINAKELPWTDMQLLPKPEESASNEIVPLISGQIRIWSEYYRSSFYVSESAGIGSYGEVWRGVMLEGGSRIRVVLKRIYSHKGMAIVSSAMREVYFGSSLGQSRPHISRLINHFVEDRDLWLVFHDEGISLYQSIFHPVFVNGLSIMYRSTFWEQTRADPSITIEIIQQVLQGLANLHELNITHRDVKLENIFINPANRHVRIGDLGSAARGSNEPYILQSLFPPNGPSLNEETLRYSPPERIGISEDSLLSIDPSLDIWCVGILWLEFFLGTIDLGLEDARKGICVRQANCSNLAERIQQRDPLNRGIENTEVLDLIESLLAFDPKNRPTAIEALNHPIFATPTSGPVEVTMNYALSQGGRSAMEDFAVVKSDGSLHLACVLDGHNGDGIAKVLSVELQKPLTTNLREIIQSLIDRVHRESDLFGSMEGSTLCCMLLDDKTGEVRVANIGDSRFVLVETVSGIDWKPEIGGRVKFGSQYDRFGHIVGIKDGHIIVTPENQPNRRTVAREVRPATEEPIRVRQITVDHKPDNPEEMKYIESVGGFVSGSPARVDGVLAISRSIGVKAMSHVVRQEVDFFTINLSETTAKRFVIASDGVWDVLTNQQVGELAEKGPEAIIKTASENGARDNMAVIVVDLFRHHQNRQINEEL